MRFLYFILSSGALLGLMLFVRTFCRKWLSPGAVYALWLIPALRLLVPVGVVEFPALSAPYEWMEESVAGLEDILEEAYVPDNSLPGYEEAETDTEAALPAGGDAARPDSPVKAMTKTESEAFADVPSVAVSPKPAAARGREAFRFTLPMVMGFLWAAGSMAAALFAFFANRRIRGSIYHMDRHIGDCPLPVGFSERVASPCLFGCVSPCIVLSRAVYEDRTLFRQILRHELEHYRQKDHIWTALRILLCILYWWNPLVWLCAACAREDAELSCDARVIRRLGRSERKEYGLALVRLLEQAQGRPAPLYEAASSSVGAKDIKRRMENIVRARPAKNRLLLPVLLGLAVVFWFGFAAPPAQGKSAQGSGAKEPQSAVRAAETAVMTEEEERPETEDGQDESAKAENGEAKGGEADDGWHEAELTFCTPAWAASYQEPQDMEKVEEGAQRALHELYQFTGYQVESCVYTYCFTTDYSFARTEEDMEHSRVFYSRTFEVEGDEQWIPSMDLVSARSSWYSDIQQLYVPEGADRMTDEELAVWFLKRSALFKGGDIVSAARNYLFADNTAITVTMADGRFYEVLVDRDILTATNIYGPYPEGSTH